MSKRNLIVDVALAAVILVLALTLFPRNANGQTTTAEPPCFPSNSALKGTGTDAELFETATVSGFVGWCPSTNGGWHIRLHSWCLKSLCGKQPPTTGAAVMSAIARVMNAADVAAQAKIEWAAAARPLTTDLEKWQFRDWRHQACQWLTSTQPGVTPRPALPIALPNNTWVPPLNYCDPLKPGAQPVPPAGWKAYGGTIYKHGAGKLIAPLIGKTAAKDAACTGVTVATAGAFVFQELVGGTAGEATRCVMP